jgi:Bacterial PH domain/Short C-terminal domain
MRVKLGGGREIKRLTEYLWEGEQVERMTTGAYGKGTGLVVLTDRRLLFLQHGIMSQTTEDFPLDKVSSIQWSSGMMLGMITVFASGNKAEIKNVNKGDGKEIVDLIRHRLSDKTPPANPATTGGGGQDVYEQLRKLGELHTGGVLTDEEFEKKKADLLGRL